MGTLHIALDDLPSPKHIKYRQAAQNALKSLCALDAVLREEVECLVALSAAGQPMDTNILDLMRKVRSEHLQVVLGMEHLDDEQERNALISYADAVHDLMLRVHAANKEQSQ